MVDYPHLTRPPITEAVIDFRCARSDASSIENLRHAQEALGSNYYLKAPIFQAQLMIGVSDQAPTTSTSTEIGIRLHSLDEKYVIQWTLDGCALSRLEPYESWEALNAEARRIWPFYRDAIKPTHISRAAVRYINNLKLPMSHGEKFDDYMTAAPQVAEGLPQAVGSFLQRVVVRDSQTSALAAITHAYDSHNIDDDVVPVILDIDVFLEREFAVSEATLWQHLENLRAFKNMIFFRNITQKALSGYL